MKLLRLSLWCIATLAASVVMLANVQAQPSPVSGDQTRLTFEDARHLLGRTSFAAQPNEIAELAKLTRSDAVDRLLDLTRRKATYPAPEWTAKYERVFRPEMAQDERQALQRREQVVRGLELRTWWLAEMLSTPTPFTEKMTLFWHNHFATSQQKVRVAYPMYRQNTLFRQHAFGNFGVLLREISKDPAMLVYLDGAQNRRGMPNENFAREVMELFTLGEGNYSERDIKEVARAFTGWSIDLDAGEFRFRRMQHDDGEKTIFGQTGKFNGDDVVTLLLKHEKTAEFIVRKLWTEFVSDTLDPADAREIKRIAAIFRESGYELKPTMRALLLSPSFWQQKNRATLVKSPIELVVGSLRQFRVEVEDPAPFAVITRQLGQDLFGPPNVKGWPGGEAWLTTTTLLARKGFLNRLFRADEMGKPDMTTAASGAAAALVDRDLMGERRQRAMTRLATVDRMGERDGSMMAVKAGASESAGMKNPIGMSFGVTNALKGQYYFDAAKWFAQYPNQSDHDALWKTLLAGPPVQVTELKFDLAGLRTLALDPMYQLK
jgi:uncharacterized protein (DUF1800 family)